MKKIVNFLLDVLFPARCPWCDQVLGFEKNCSCEETEETLDTLRLPDDPLNFAAEGRVCEHLSAAWACFHYIKPVDGVILRMKFEEDLLPASSLGALMAAKFHDCELAGHFDLLVPVPVSKKTLRHRGYNQSAVLAKYVAEQTGLLLLADALIKDKETTRQMDLSREERQNNVRDAYKVADAALVYGRRILLVDDVITTGSTLDECAKVLLAAGAAECAALCLAATDKPQVRKMMTDARKG